MKLNDVAVRKAKPEVEPDAMRDRVSAVSGIFIGSANELGAMKTGVDARLGLKLGILQLRQMH